MTYIEGPRKRPRNIVSVDDLDGDHLDWIFSFASQLKSGAFPKIVRLNAKQLAISLFWEPSTRTITSFEAAACRVGIDHIKVQDMKATSLQKGESFADTIRAYSSYADALVLRHPQSGIAQVAADISSVPIINAGDGSNEHPTQALLDLYTMQERLPDRFTKGSGADLGQADITITFVGDLKYGRTVHSLAKLLARFEGVHINYVALPELQIEDAFVEALGVPQTKSVPHMAGENLDPVDWDNLSEEESGALFAERIRKSFEEGWTPALTPEILAQTDVLYMTRVQKERASSIRAMGFPMPPKPDVLTPELAGHLPDHAVIMHPFPRVDEIDPAIDSDKRVAYFDQMENGMWVRAALLTMMLS